MRIPRTAGNIMHMIGGGGEGLQEALWLKTSPYFNSPSWLLSLSITKVEEKRPLQWPKKTKAVKVLKIMLLARAVIAQWWVISWSHVADKINCLHPASSPLLDIDISQCKNGYFMQEKDANICVHHSRVFAAGGCCDNYKKIFIQSAKHFFVIDSFWLLGSLKNCTLGAVQ